MDNMSLESTVHGLSTDAVMFEIDVGICKKISKMQVILRTNRLNQHANVVMVGVCLFCAIWAILASLWQHLTCCCLCTVGSSLILFRYGKFLPLWLLVVEVLCM